MGSSAEGVAFAARMSRPARPMVVLTPGGLRRYKRSWAGAWGVRPSNHRSRQQQWPWCSL